MTVLDHYPVAGRGTAIVIDARPAELQCGARVVCGEAEWTVIGVEKHSVPRDCVGEPAGVLLTGGPLPKIGSVLEVVRSSL